VNLAQTAREAACRRSGQNRSLVVLRSSVTDHVAAAQRFVTASSTPVCGRVALADRGARRTPITTSMNCRAQPAQAQPEEGDRRLDPAIAAGEIPLVRGGAVISTSDVPPHQTDGCGETRGRRRRARCGVCTAGGPRERAPARPTRRPKARSLAK